MSDQSQVAMTETELFADYDANAVRVRLNGHPLVPQSTETLLTCWAKVLRDKDNVLTMSAREKIAKLLDAAAQTRS